MTSVDDPERHFLGNLLDDDPGGGPVNSRSNSDSTTSQSSSNTTNSVISAPFRPLGSTYWPEPPPPYTPPISTDSWFSTPTESSTATEWLSILERKDQQATNQSPNSAELFSINLSANTGVNPVAQQSQVHHFHHNLHHHTHTHNVVQNHYFTTTPPGLELNQNWNYAGIGNVSSNSSQVLFSDWKKENMGLKSKISDGVENSPGITREICGKSYAEASNVAANPIGAEKKQKQELAKKLSQIEAHPVSRIVVNGQPHSAPVMSKMPFSYRDVAARVDTANSSASSNTGGSPPLAAEKNAQKQSNGDMMVRMVGNKNRTMSNLTNKNVTEEPKTKKENSGNVDNEFQKITRKSHKKNMKIHDKNISNCSQAPVWENTQPVDVSSRYNILNNLENMSPRHRNVEKKSTTASNNRALVIEQIYSRSSSAADEDNLEETEGEEVLKKNGGGVSQQTQGSRKEKKRATTLPATQRRRPRKKSEPNNWMEALFWSVVDFLMVICGYMRDLFEWVLQLICDVCIKIYDVFLLSIETLVKGTTNGIRKISQSVVNFLIQICVFIWCIIQSLSISNLLEQILYEEEEMSNDEWGCKSNMPVPTYATDYIERLMSLQFRDAYVVLGLRSDCADHDIQRNFKRLTALVSPDKCNLDGAEEAFELLNCAFECIGKPDLRSTYLPENVENDVKHKNLLSIWNELRERAEDVRSTIFCDCGTRHAREATKIRPNEARYCRRCDNTHPAKQNDIWIEKRFLGLKTIYLTCTDNVVYDISEWATCESQRNMLRNMKAHTHHVQYRLVTPQLMNDDVMPSTQISNMSAHAPSDSRVFGEFADDHSLHRRQQRNLVQVSFKTCEPREEDRSRRAANRRQKRWR